MKHEIGDKAKFIEHLVQLVDIDSGGDTKFADCIFFKEGTEDVEKKACDAVKKQHGYLFGGNAVEAEYLGETGAVKWGEYAILKTGWKTTETISERKPEMEPDKYMTMG